MSTRSTTHFTHVKAGTPEAIIYRHSDGYPEGHGADLLRFFDDVKAQTSDTRFGDPSYLAAKLVVWLANEFRDDGAMLDFISVGVVAKDPGDIEYLYEIVSSDLSRGRPAVWVWRYDGKLLGEIADVLATPGGDALGGR